VVCVGGDLRIDQHGWQPFWSAMIHAVRNAVDHGIEDAAQRREAGKPEAGAIELGAERSDGQLRFWIRDDGRGIDWQRLASRALARGVPCDSHADLVRALFVDGVTTRDVATELSGRGVGLSALHQVVEALGGAIEVHSVPGEGAEFRFTFDERRTSEAAAAAPRLPRTSLLPFQM
jgi:two-component system chemotaxis sensor kinase CheA